MSTGFPPADGKTITELGAAFPNSGPGVNAIQFPETHAIQVESGDHTHECSCRPFPTNRDPDPFKGCTNSESFRTIAIESPVGDQEADLTIESSGAPFATTRADPPSAGDTYALLFERKSISSL